MQTVIAFSNKALAFAVKHNFGAYHLEVKPKKGEALSQLKKLRLSYPNASTAFPLLVKYGSTHKPGRVEECKPSRIDEHVRDYKDDEASHAGNPLMCWDTALMMQRSIYELPIEEAELVGANCGMFRVDGSSEKLWILFKSKEDLDKYLAYVQLFKGLHPCPEKLGQPGVYDFEQGFRDLFYYTRGEAKLLADLGIYSSDTAVKVASNFESNREKFINGQKNYLGQLIAWEKAQRDKSQEPEGGDYGY